MSVPLTSRKTRRGEREEPARPPDAERQSLALRESEDRLRMLADNMSQLAWTCDLLGNVTWYNKRWLEYTGLTFEDMKGWGWAKVQHPDHVDRVVAHVRRSGDTGEPWEDTFPLRGRDGQYRWFLSRAVPIRDERGAVAQWFGTNTDVTEQKRAEEEVARQARELRELNQRLQELDRLKTEFFSNVSHEFRTPLTLMLGPVDELLRTSPPGTARAELAMIGRNGRRLLKLVNALLDFSRLEAGRAEAVYEPTDLSVVTREIAGVFRSTIERAGLRLIVDCAPVGEAVNVDPEMWETIVLNLLSNAFKFTLTGEIAVTLRHSETHVQLAVRDTGAGIPPHELPHLFERFHRVKGRPGRTHEGAGIGLALVRQLVTLHGGTVAATSIEGRETSVEVLIPRGHAHLPPERIRARARDRAATRAMAYVDEALRWLPGDTGVEAGEPSVANAPVPADGASGRRAFVLCVDDNADMRSYLGRLLSSQYEVETAEDGAAALRAVRRRTPDLVVADVMMPGMDGLRFVRALREDAQTGAVPVILLSARAGEEARVDGLQAGADDYLVKPFSSRELLARVAAHLELARMRTEMFRQERSALVAVEAGEQERRRISRELHDEMGQQLAALTLGVKAVRATVAGGSPSDTSLKRLQTMAERAGREMHRIALELRPAALDERGLQAGLANYVDEWSQRSDVRVDFQSVGLEAHRLPPSVETIVYRIVQEALMNVHKHARATTVSVVLQRHARDMVAIVEDDGIGFDVEHARRSGRLGLLGMKERVALVGGTCDIESEAGRTSVFVRIPVEHRQGRHTRDD